MEPLVLKKSCDSCTNSKVKCSGGFPCERCVQKKIQCFYSPRKRRSKPKKPKRSKNGMGDGGLLSSASFDPSAPMGSLVEWERRSWSVFFTLYKHYGTSCSLHWFNRQLNKMRKYLSRQGNKESLKRLTSWMNALNIDVDALAAEVERCRVRCYEKRNGLALKVKGTVKDELRMQARLQQTSEKIPFLKLVAEYPGNMKEEEEEVSIECNAAFSSVFGITEKALQEQLRWTGGGFLPWGGDILARILTKEKDLLAFVQILAIKFNTLTRPKEFPNVRDIPSCHMFEVNIREKATSGNLIPVNALVKCMHREIISAERCAMEISMEFTPLAPHDHLLNSGLLPADVAKTTTPTVLNIATPVIPFSTKGDAYIEQRKRSFDNYEIEDPVEGAVEAKEDLYQEPYQASAVKESSPPTSNTFGGKAVPTFKSFDSINVEAFENMNDLLHVDPHPQKTEVTRFDSFEAGSHGTAPTGMSRRTSAMSNSNTYAETNSVSARSVSSYSLFSGKGKQYESQLSSESAPPQYSTKQNNYDLSNMGPEGMTNVRTHLNKSTTLDDPVAQELGKFAKESGQPGVSGNQYKEDIDEIPDLLPSNEYFDEQADWLDGLLDWANKQDLVTN